ncbi:MAG: DUF177 domain-containing protein [Chloroflexi bacterium]|nr:DUF177 domain-containing protein [Chloroflexota bacterium]
MRFNVAQLLKSGIGSTREYDISDDSIELEDAKVVSPCRGHVKLTRVLAGILVDASIVVTITLSCSRCLEDLAYQLEIRFSEEFEPTVDVLTGVRLELPDDSGAFTIDENHILDLTRAAQEYGVLALPMQPLCRPDCAGLCPECGHNRNLGSCKCTVGDVDSRLAVLQSLLEGQREES